jgi:hypothetical protein
LKLLRISRSLNPSGGGIAEGVRQITPHLQALGVATTLASLDPADAPWLAQQGCPTIGLGPVQSGYGYRRGLPARIRALSQQHDAVIIEGIWQYHAYATWRAFLISCTLTGCSIPGLSAPIRSSI